MSSSESDKDRNKSLIDALNALGGKQLEEEQKAANDKAADGIAILYYYADKDILPTGVAEYFAEYGEEFNKAVRSSGYPTFPPLDERSVSRDIGQHVATLASDLQGAKRNNDVLAIQRDTAQENLRHANDRIELLTDALLAISRNFGVRIELGDDSWLDADSIVIELNRKIESDKLNAVRDSLAAERTSFAGSLAAAVSEARDETAERYADKIAWLTSERDELQRTFTEHDKLSVETVRGHYASLSSIIDMTEGLLNNLSAAAEAGIANAGSIVGATDDLMAVMPQSSNRTISRWKAFKIAVEALVEATAGDLKHPMP